MDSGVNMTAIVNQWYDYYIVRALHKPAESRAEAPPDVFEDPA